LISDSAALVDEEKVTQLVMPKLKEASDKMQGWVLDGFPRTRLQTTYLKEAAMVPAHVLVLKASEEQIRERNASIERGEMEGSYSEADLLERKLRLHLCYGAAALEIYNDRISVIDTEAGEDAVLTEMVRKTRMVQRLRGFCPPPPRVVLLGPRGVGLQEHGARLAARLGCVMVDGKALEANAYDRYDNNSRIDSSMVSQLSMQAMPTEKKKKSEKRANAITTLDVVNQERMIDNDPLGVVGVRLRQPDCVKQGWVLCGYPEYAEIARALQDDVWLRPTRIVALSPSEETCVQRLRNILHDPVTGNVWTCFPRNESIRKRLVRNPEDQPGAVSAAFMAFRNSLPGIFQSFQADGRCNEIPADGAPALVFKELVEFVERPLPLQQLGSS